MVHVRLDMIAEAQVFGANDLERSQRLRRSECMFNPVLRLKGSQRVSAKYFYAHAVNTKARAMVALRRTIGALTSRSL